MANQESKKPEAKEEPKAPASVVPAHLSIAKETAVAREPGSVKPVVRNVLTKPKATDVVQGVKRDRH